MKIHIVAVTSLMGALALLLAPSAAAEFDRAGYLRCIVSDAMSVGGLSIDSRSAAKLGAEAYAALGGQPQTTADAQQEAAALAKEHGLSESLTALIVRCAQTPHS
ncbi:MAG: hypothetical protein M3O32_11675 [Actinomycetota bacterium]|nr:hypothetical protein [Actinomycetota bacterium]